MYNKFDARFPIIANQMCVKKLWFFSCEMLQEGLAVLQQHPHKPGVELLQKQLSMIEMIMKMIVIEMIIIEMIVT